jgi:DNA topoisomerase-1
VALLAEPSKGRRTPPGKNLGNHPADEKPVTLHSGRYGPYVKHGKLNATLPRDREPESFTLDEAVALLAAQAERKGVKPPKAAKPAAAKSTKSKAKAKKAAPTEEAEEPESEAPKPVRKRAAG